MQAKAQDCQGEWYSVQLNFLCNVTHPHQKVLKGFLMVSSSKAVQKTFATDCWMKNKFKPHLIHERRRFSRTTH